MYGNDLWRVGSALVLTVERGDLRLIVRAPEETGGYVRFLVLRRGTGGSPDALVGSGAERNVRAAMEAAERMAERCARLGKGVCRAGSPLPDSVS